MAHHASIAASSSSRTIAGGVRRGGASTRPAKGRSACVAARSETVMELDAGTRVEFDNLIPQRRKG